MYDIYQIQAGDTIDTLANKYSVSPEVLRQLNPNSSFGVGTNIIVPRENEYFEVYTINKGDTLYEIARRYNTDYHLLALLNGLNVNDYIYPGTTILVPKRNVKYYITKNNDTLLGVNKLLEGDINKLIKQNSNIYLQEGQLIVYK
ncbi:MAG: LysM peptidoglycan-binding domain-containing protein [Bacilli bacterium]